MRICSSNKCTGCGACVAACHCSCIKLEEDDWAALHPVIDEERCIHCSKCLRVCPATNKPKFRYPIKCYASWLKDKKTRLKCASGGIGTAIAEHVIKSLEGVAFGAAYDSEFNVHIVSANALSDVQMFRGSKYVYSHVSSSTYNEVRSLCEQSRMVVFLGLPCQIAGLLNYLGRDYACLITVDLICHGVCPSRYLTDEIESLRKKHKLGHISDVRFRGNDGHNFCFTLWDKTGRLLYDGNWWSHNRYLVGFLSGVSLRENCYICAYARPERVSDLTIGDFIGLGKKIEFNSDSDNVSVVIANTQKGHKFYHELLASDERIESQERPYLERLEYRASIMEPFARHPLRKRFRDLYPKLGYCSSIRKALVWYVFRSRAYGLFTAGIRMLSKICCK